MRIWPSTAFAGEPARRICPTCGMAMRGGKKECRFCRSLTKAETSGFISRGRTARRRISRLRESDDGLKDKIVKLIENEGIHAAISQMI